MNVALPAPECRSKEVVVESSRFNSGLGIDARQIGLEPVRKPMPSSWHTP